MNPVLARSIGLPQYTPGVPGALPMADAPVGVILVNLGTPTAPEPRAIRRFLKEFLSDPRVVEIPKPLWWLILNGIILNVRPRKIQDKYASVWLPEGSPLMVYSRRQQVALAQAMQTRGLNVKVELGMRYGEPSLASAIDALRAQGCERMLVLPLYPQYAASTTATVLDKVAEHLRGLRSQPELRFVQRYGQDSGYIAALAAQVGAHWAQYGRAHRLLMSFHGLPKVSIQQGDPYHGECLDTAHRLTAALGLTEADVVVTFQSRFGAQEWLQPYTEPTIQALARDGVRTLDVICPGFAVDCLETLEEVAQGCAETFHAAGGESLRYIPALNDAPAWIDALADLAERNLLGWLPMRP